MANKNFEIKNGLTVAGTERITSAGLLTGTTSTQAASDNTTKLASTAYVTTALANLTDSAPSTLNTLNELAAALGDDANYATTTTNAIATKAPLASPTFTGTIKMQSNGAYFRDGVGNSLSSGWDATGDDHATWINFEGYQGGTTKFRDLRIGNGKQAAFVHFDGSAASVAISGALTATGLTVDTSAGQLDVEALGGSSVKVKSDGSLKIEATGGSVSLINGSTEVLSTTSTGISVTGNIAKSSGDLTIDVGGRIDLSADDNGEIRFFDGSSMYGQIKDDDDRLKIQGLISNKAMLLVGNDNGQEVTMLSLDAEAAGAATFNSSLTIPDYVIHSGNTSTKFGFGSANTMNFISNGSDRLTIANSYAVFNEAGTDYDFRVESNGNTHMLFVDGGNNRVGVGTASPSSQFEVQGTNANNKINSYFSGSYTSGFKFSDLNGGIWYDAAADDLTISAGHANSQLIMASGGSERMRISSSGNVSMTVDLTVGNSYLSNNYASFANMRINNNAYIGSANTPSAIQIQTGGGVAFGYDVTVPNINVADDIRHTGDSDTYLSFENNYLGMYAGGNNALILQASGASIKLGGSGAANTLDDYEEGNWTPVIQGLGGNAATFVSSTARYTKIGNLVTVSWYAHTINLSAITSGSYIVLTGLPFAATNYADFSINYRSGGWTDNSTAIAGGYVQLGQSYLYFVRPDGVEPVQSGGFAISRMMLNVTYRA